MEKLESYIEANLSNEQFNVGQLAAFMGMSRSHLHRKLHKIKGKSISRFIREYRLKVVRGIFVEKEMTVSGVSHGIGFQQSPIFHHFRSIVLIAQIMIG